MAMLNNQMVVMPYNGPCICIMVHVFKYDFLLWTVDILVFFWDGTCCEVIDQVGCVWVKAILLQLGF